MAWIYDYAPAIALIPLASFLVALFLGRYMPKRGALSGIVATGTSLLLSVWALVHLSGPAEPHHQTLYTFVTGAGEEAVTLTFGILLDPLSTLMLVIVSLISFLVHVFSLGYMNDEGETGLPRYYAGLGLFTFSMLSFVLADSLLVAFVFVRGVSHHMTHLCGGVNKCTGVRHTYDVTPGGTGYGPIRRSTCTKPKSRATACRSP